MWYCFVFSLAATVLSLFDRPQTTIPNTKSWNSVHHVDSSFVIQALAHSIYADAGCCMMWCLCGLLYISVTILRPDGRTHGTIGCKMRDKTQFADKCCWRGILGLWRRARFYGSVLWGRLEGSMPHTQPFSFAQRPKNTNHWSLYTLPQVWGVPLPRVWDLPLHVPRVWGVSMIRPTYVLYTLLSGVSMYVL